MKKITSVLLSLLILFSFFGCTFVQPQDKATEFLSAIKSGNKDVLMGYANNKYVNMLVNSSGDEETLNKIYKNLFKNFNYKIVSTTIDEKTENATIKVEITNVDFKNVLKNYEKESYEYIVDNLYSDSKTTKSNLNKQCLKILSNAIEDAAKSIETKTKTVDIKLTKNENYSYDLTIDKTLMDALTGGIISSFEE